MSDFDKEAEREKLREKYGRDEDDREATERMSDLLLKGATMTNTHCGTCGDPIFRYEGQEFCSTCQEVVAEADDAPESEQTVDEPTETGEAADTETSTADTGPNATADAAADAPDGRPVETDTETPRPGVNGQSEAGAADAPSGTASGNADAGTDAPTETAGRPADAPTGHPTTGDNAPADWTTSIDPSVADAVETGGQSTGTSQATAPEYGATGPESTAPSAAGDLASARASLTKTITRLTRQAAASDDLERTRAYLAAVEEAADALAAVKRADR